ncbi:hypothetical protein B0H14DRAFT_2570001 [Mycena olivaceomarginata]|nr:hypothetical protein B0H14DRAFT_2570001 [Mycena olivaceomarginata]
MASAIPTPTLFNFAAAKSFAITATEEVTQALPSASSASTPATTSKGNSSSTLRLGSTKSSGSTTPTSPNGSPVPSGLLPSSKRRRRGRHENDADVFTTVPYPPQVISAASLMPIPTQSSLDTRGVSKVRRQILQNELRVTQDKMAEIHRLHDALPREPAPGFIHPSSGSRPDLLGSYVAAAGKKRGVGGAYSRVGSKHGISMGAWPLGGASAPIHRRRTSIIMGRDQIRVIRRYPAYHLVS